MCPYIDFMVEILTYKMFYYKKFANILIFDQKNGGTLCPPPRNKRIKQTKNPIPLTQPVIVLLE